MRKAQTATEYLIILAVVIVIALIVIGVIGEIPGVGSGTSERNTQAYLKTQEIGVESYSVTNSTIRLELKNNRQDSVEVTNIQFYNGSEWKSCDSTSDLPLMLLTGEKSPVNCNELDVGENLGVGKTFSLPINVTYKDRANDVIYNIEGQNYKIEGKVGVATFEDSSESIVSEGSD